MYTEVVGCIGGGCLSECLLREGTRRALSEDGRSAVTPQGIGMVNETDSRHDASPRASLL